MTNSTVVGTIQFKEIAKLLESISNARKPEHKRTIFKSFLDKWREFYSEIHHDHDSAPEQSPETFFPFMRLLMPQFDKDRPVYGIKANKLANLIIGQLGLNKESDDAKRLLEFKKDLSGKQQGKRDFAEVAFEILKKRDGSTGKKPLTVEEVNQLLDTLADANVSTGENKRKTIEEVIMDILRKLSAEEQKWVIRIIIKDLKLGMSPESMFDVFHPDARELYDVNMSVSTVCAKLHDPSVRMGDLDVRLFAPIKPMLAQRWNDKEMKAALKSSVFISELKLDGDRCQIHMKQGEFRYFSRLGTDNTEDLGKDAKSGNLTPRIADCFDPTVESFIIDGEICPYNKKIDAIVSRMESTKITKLNGSGDLQNCFVAFDIVFLNGKAVTGLPFRERMALLDKLFQEQKGGLYRSRRKEVRTPQDCYDELNQATDQNEEGIMLKKPDSVYKPNARNAGWWKFKATDATPSGQVALNDTLDLLIVGGLYGQGKKHGITHFLMAVSDAEKPGEVPKRFLPVCRVSGGLTDMKLADIAHKLDDKWHDISTLPPGYFKAPGGDSKPAKWIKPEDSIILEIKANEIMEADKYASGFALRFPRVQKVRDDKAWTDCMTKDELIRLKTLSSGTLGPRNVGENHFEESPRKKAKVTGRGKAALTLPEQFRPAANITHKEGFLTKKFYVALGDVKNSKQDLERKIQENGGTTVQSPDENTFCIIASKMNMHVSNLVKSTPIDVVKPSWLLKCIESGKFLAWHPDDLLWLKPETQILLRTVFDEYGDSFTDDINIEDLERFLKLADLQNKVTDVAATDIAEMEEDAFDEFSMVGLFRLVNAYIDFECASPGVRALLETIETLVANHGGKTMNDPSDSTVTHVVVSSTLADHKRLEELKALNHHRHGKFLLVTEQWVLDSVSNKARQNEKLYFPRLPADSREKHPSLLELV